MQQSEEPQADAVAGVGLALDVPTIDDVRAAADVLVGEAVVTPLVENAVLNDAVGGRVLLKCENLQRTGAFKFRGAFNAVSRIDRDMFPGGVVACSSGNHAQGIAEAARLLDVPAVVVMPADAPHMKIARTKRSGAEVVLYDRWREDRDAIANTFARERQARFVAPFDDSHVIAGQGTVGLEMCAQADALGARLDRVLVPASGAGLTSGVALAVKDRWPGAKVHPVEPRGYERIAAALAAGEVVALSGAGEGSICDALLSKAMGALTFAIGREHFSEPLSVGDDVVRCAVRFAFEELKMVLEPGGAIALAALVNGELDVSGQTVGVVLSGGNVDPAAFAALLASDDGEQDEAAAATAGRA